MKNKSIVRSVLQLLFRSLGEAHVTGNDVQEKTKQGLLDAQK